MMHSIELKLHALMYRVARGQEPRVAQLIKDALNAASNTMSESFTTKDEFRLRLSNVGKPLCQLQMEAKYGVSIKEEPFFTLKMSLGHFSEAVAVALLKAAGVNIQSEQEKVSLKVPLRMKQDNKTVVEIGGTLDLVIDGKVWDVKSASPFSYTNKFASYNSLRQEDTFGYIPQLFGYAEAKGLEVGGWIVINKATGDIKVIEAVESKEERERALGIIHTNVNAILSSDEFKALYSDVPETFKKIPTGNRVLQSPCTFCDFKTKCWPSVVRKVSQVGESQNPGLKWYTKLVDRVIEVEPPAPKQRGRKRKDPKP